MASLMVLGLAPAAHGGNRTGRVFTGDASATFLIRRRCTQAGLANQPVSDHRDDGLQYHGAYVCAAVRCVPPQRSSHPRRAAQLPSLSWFEGDAAHCLTCGLCHGPRPDSLPMRLSECMSELSADNHGKKKPLRAKFQHGQVPRFWAMTYRCWWAATIPVHATPTPVGFQHGSSWWKLWKWQRGWPEG